MAFEPIAVNWPVVRFQGAHMRADALILHPRPILAPANRKMVFLHRQKKGPLKGLNNNAHPIPQSNRWNLFLKDKHS